MPTELPARSHGLWDLWEARAGLHHFRDSNMEWDRQDPRLVLSAAVKIPTTWFASPRYGYLAAVLFLPPDSSALLTWVTVNEGDNKISAFPSQQQARLRWDAIDTLWTHQRDPQCASVPEASCAEHLRDQPLIGSAFIILKSNLTIQTRKMAMMLERDQIIITLWREVSFMISEELTVACCTSRPLQTLRRNLLSSQRVLIRSLVKHNNSLPKVRIWILQNHGSAG